MQGSNDADVLDVLEGEPVLRENSQWGESPQAGICVSLQEVLDV